MEIEIILAVGFMSACGDMVLILDLIDMGS